MKTMAYPASFFVSLGTVLLVMLLNILFIRVNFSYINSISGWTYYQVLGVVGSYMIVEGTLWVFFAMLNPISEHIRAGTLDGILLKPVDAQFLTSFFKNDLEDIVRIITGAVLIFLAIRNTIGFGLGHFILFLLLLVNGIIIMYSFDIMVRSVSFWVIDGTGLWLLMERISGNSQYPTDIYYQKIVRGFFTFVIPLAFMATVPAKVLTNKNIDFQLVGISFLTMVTFFVGSRLFWKFSLKHYSSASS